MNPRAVTLTVADGGIIELIATQQAAELPELSLAGTVTRRRASHVEPINWLARIAFHVIRAAVADESLVADWTRRWTCRWRARIFGGPVLQPFADRSAAIAAEIDWLERNRLS